jgi:alpha-L-rhamnosidase
MVGSARVGSEWAGVEGFRTSMVGDGVDKSQRMDRFVDWFAGRGRSENRLNTGFVGTPYLNHVLTASGRLDVAYELLMQKNWPSWLYSVTHGATTIWERWDGWTHDRGFQNPQMNSFNHYAYGAVGAWLYQVVAGIQVDPQRPGYEHVIFRPHPLVGGPLTHAQATLETIRGRVESGWRLAKDGRLRYEVRVPVNVTATAYVPAVNGRPVTESGKRTDKAPGVKVLRAEKGRAVFELESGRYVFESVMK